MHFKESQMVTDWIVSAKSGLSAGFSLRVKSLKLKRERVISIFY